MTIPDRYRPLYVSLASMAMFWLSFPPVGWWWLAWFAPVPLIWLIITPPADAGTQEVKPDTDFSTKKPLFASWPTKTNSYYRMFFLAGFAYWLATFYFIPYPHPALWFGWLAISLYMAIYTPLVVGSSRLLIHRYRVPVIIAVPVVWTGFEWFRCNFATGMAMVCLSHTQFRQPHLIQVADLSGAYTLTFVIVLFASAIASASFPRKYLKQFRLFGTVVTAKEIRLAHVLTAALAFHSVLEYGKERLNSPIELGENILKVALIQSSIDVIFTELTAEEAEYHDRQYLKLTTLALKEKSDLDLVICPESSFRPFDLLSDYGEQATKEHSAENIRSFWKALVSEYPAESKPDLIAGGTSYDPDRGEMFNSALWIQAPGVIAGRYFKHHRVVLGEYVPFSDWFPFLQSTPIGRGLTSGSEFVVFDVQGIRLAPNICFESTVPHLIRRQVKTLDRKSETPDVLVNLTNDGWFFGSSCLDLHLACNVFRSVEMRKPTLVCANTGFSAYIDSRGILKIVGPRRQAEWLYAEVQAELGLQSLYLTIGDLLPQIFGFLCIGVVMLECFKRLIKAKTKSKLD